MICILFISLVEAFFILPAHLEGTLTPSKPVKSRVYKFLFFWLVWLKSDIFYLHGILRYRLEKWLNRIIYSMYLPVLRYCVKNRYFTLSVGAGCLLISFGLIAGGHVPYTFFPKNDSNWLISEIVYPLGTPVETTEKTIKQLENGAFKLNDLFKDRVKDKSNLIVNSFSLVGVIPRRDWKPGVHGGHCGEVWIEIKPAADRPDVLAGEVAAEWRKLTGDILGAEQSSFTIIGGGPGGNPIEIRLHGSDLGMMEQAAKALKEEISTYPGTFDITDDFRPGKMEKQIYIRPGAESLGVTMADIATQIRQAYYGDEGAENPAGQG